MEEGKKDLVTAPEPPKDKKTDVPHRSLHKCSTDITIEVVDPPIKETTIDERPRECEKGSDGNNYGTP